MFGCLRFAAAVLRQLVGCLRFGCLRFVGSCTIDRGRPPICFANGSLPPRDELPLINVQTALNLYYDLEVLSPTRYENRGKVHLVGRF